MNNQLAKLLLAVVPPCIIQEAIKEATTWYTGLFTVMTMVFAMAASAPIILFFGGPGSGPEYLFIPGSLFLLLVCILVVSERREKLYKREAVARWVNDSLDDVDILTIVGEVQIKSLTEIPIAELILQEVQKAEGLPEGPIRNGARCAIEEKLLPVRKAVEQALNTAHKRDVIPHITT